MNYPEQTLACDGRIAILTPGPTSRVGQRDDERAKVAHQRHEFRELVRIEQRRVARHPREPGTEQPPRYDRVALFDVVVPQDPKNLVQIIVPIDIGIPLTNIQRKAPRPD